MRITRYASFLIILGAMTFPSPLIAACHTVYENICTEHDKDGRCNVWERQSRDVCDNNDNGFNSNPRECFVCFQWNKDGSCNKTHKVSC